MLGTTKRLSVQNLTTIGLETVEILTILAICTFSKWVIQTHTYIHEIEELTGVAFTKQRLLKIKNKSKKEKKKKKNTVHTAAQVIISFQ